MQIERWFVFARRARKSVILAAGVAMVLFVAGVAHAQVLAPVIAKSFTPSTVVFGQTSVVTVTVTNPNPATALTAVNFTDTFPAGIAATSPSGLTSNCGGVTVYATGPPLTLSLSGGALAAATTCTITGNVVGTIAGPQVNTTGAVTSAEGGTGNTATATLDVLGPPVLTKAFGAGSIFIGSSTTLAFQITNPNDVAMTGIAMTDNLPGNLIVATPNGLIGSCAGGTITAVPGSSAVTLSGATLAAGAFCQFAVNVFGTVPGTAVNVATASGTTVGTSAPATATLQVNVPVPAMNVWWLLMIASALAAFATVVLRRRRLA